MRIGGYLTQRAGNIVLHILLSLGKDFCGCRCRYNDAWRDLIANVESKF
jgi:hypothetical protein